MAPWFEVGTYSHAFSGSSGPVHLRALANGFGDQGLTGVLER